MRSKIFALILFFIMWCIFGWSYDIHDYPNYEETFVNSQSMIELGLVNIGYNYINYFFCSKDWSFFEFRILYSFICIFALFVVIYKYSIRPSIVLILYGITIFFVDLVQMKNFLAYLFCLFGLGYLLDNNIKGKIKYLVCISIAVSIHIATIFYIIFIFTDLQKKIQWKKVFILGLVSSAFLPKVIHTVIIISGLRIHDTLFNYSIFSLIPSTAVLLFNIFVVRYFTNYNPLPSKFPLFKLGSDKKSVNLIYNINVLCLFLMPLAYLSAVSMRLDRNLVIINLIFILNRIIMNRYRMTYSQSIILIIWMTFNFLYFVFSTGVIGNIISNNYLF